MINCVINVKDKKKEEVINKNKSDKSEAFFISSMINCVIDVKDKMKEEVIDRNKSDKSKNRKIQESKEDKNEDDIIEKNVSIATKTF